MLSRGTLEDTSAVDIEMFEIFYMRAICTSFVPLFIPASNSYGLSKTRILTFCLLDYTSLLQDLLSVKFPVHIPVLLDRVPEERHS